MRNARSVQLLMAELDPSGGITLYGTVLSGLGALHATETFAEEMRDRLSAGARHFRWRRSKARIETFNERSPIQNTFKIDDLAVEVEHGGARFMMTFATREPMSFFLRRTAAMSLLDALDQCFSDNMNEKWTAGMRG